MIDRHPHSSGMPAPRPRHAGRPAPAPRVTLFRQPPEPIEPELPVARLTAYAILAAHAVMLAVDPWGAIDAVTSILTFGIR